MRRAGLEGAGCQRYRLKRQGVLRGSIAFVGLASGWFGRVRKSGNDASCAARCRHYRYRRRVLPMRRNVSAELSDSQYLHNQANGGKNAHHHDSEA